MSIFKCGADYTATAAFQTFSFAFFKLEIYTFKIIQALFVGDGGHCAW